MECPSDQEKVTFLGIAAISLAVINGCPKLQEIYLKCQELDDMVEEIAESMLQAAGRDAEVKVMNDYYG